ncbi:MAG: spondin domain-containing protein, partial [Dongiaceae bacterium]
MPRLTPRHFALAAVSALALQALSAFDAAAHQQATFTVTIRNVATDRTLELPDGTTTGVPIAPGAYAIVADGAMLYDSGSAAGSNSLEDLAEDGNAEPLIARLKATPGVREAGLFIPGQPFDVTVRPGERLVFASMFVQSNDLFLAPHPRGLALFDGKSRPLGGDVTND